jgi:hypothetical protein
MVAYALGTGSIAIALIVGFWVIVLSWLFQRGWRPFGWLFLCTAARRLAFYFQWLSFVRRRRRTEKFIALADSLWLKGRQKPIDRNFISRS